MDVNLEKIDEWVYSTLKDNATLQGYTGYTAADPRIYYFWPDIDIDDLLSTSDACIVFFKELEGELAGNNITWALQKGDCVYAVNILSRSIATCDNCKNIIDQLLDERLNITDITGWEVQRFHRLAGGGLVGRNDANVYHYHYKYRASEILKVA
ncbi:MAG: hypothetical protein A3K77_00510 [Euryarchaeota archaeon RBG_13_31_8]|nr:MAG: hypothetical protein A3K77_00510 [Euryarchaeota archaeon RBG_13_31_8]